MSTARSRAILALCIALGAVLGVAGAGMWHARSDRAAMEQIVRDYAATHPDGGAAPSAALRSAVEAGWPGAVLGNPRGKVTLTEFTDYACGYCRGSVGDVAALIAASPDLRVVVRDLAVLTPQSEDAARMALAAARQGRYDAFHAAMFAAGNPTPATIAVAARAAELDRPRARRDAASPEVSAELARNLAFARQLGFTGTPGWMVGNAVFAGAVGEGELARAVAAARG